MPSVGHKSVGKYTCFDQRIYDQRIRTYEVIRYAKLLSANYPKISFRVTK